MSEVVPPYATKAYRGSRDLASIILHLRWESCLGAGKY